MVRGFWGLQGGSGQTSQNGHFGPFRPFWGVCPEPPWRPPNSLTLLNYFAMVPLKHMTVWRHLLFWKCEILRMAAQFSPSCLGLMGKFCSSVDLLFQISDPTKRPKWAKMTILEGVPWAPLKTPQPPYLLKLLSHGTSQTYDSLKAFSFLEEWNPENGCPFQPILPWADGKTLELCRSCFSNSFPVLFGQVGHW